MANPRVRALFDDIQASREAGAIKPAASAGQATALSRLSSELLREALSTDCHYCICAQVAAARKRR
ncbi:hypothetical protein [Pseudomonas sp. LRF_L74]|uniref:hypothetical protein n=1 Tax=Pseudomonas sp. LRF_L74 TaxID=3369422 RepID=UPI003F5E2893